MKNLLTEGYYWSDKFGIIYIYQIIINIEQFFYQEAVIEIYGQPYTLFDLKKWMPIKVQKLKESNPFINYYDTNTIFLLQ